MEFKIDQALEVLRNTPRTLRAMLGELSEVWIQHNYGDNTFSPFDVVGHLIHGERTDWMVRVRMILEHGDTRPFEPFDRYAMYELSKGKTIGDLLEEFERLRCDNVAALEQLNLTPDQLLLKGLHPELGEVTLQQLLSTWVVHDLNHIHQIAKCMAIQYREQVGPWSAYISIIQM